MALVSRTLPGLFNGVSQQPPVYRLESQCAIQENAVGDLVKGLIKRPNTEAIARLGIDVNSETFVHMINGDSNERYLVIINSQDNQNPVHVFTLNGEPCTVKYNNSSREYFNTGIASKDLKCVTVADYTIITNKQVETKMKPHLPTEQVHVPTGLVWVERGFVDTTYTVTIIQDGNMNLFFAVPVPVPEEPTGNNMAKTSVIANDLYTHISKELSAYETPDGLPIWECELFGSTISIKNLQHEEFTIKVSDSYGNQALRAVKGSVQKFDDLPPEAPDGFVVTVEGTDASSFDNFYVKHRSNENGAGIWEETTRDFDDEGNFINHLPDPTTLPHKLTRTGHHEFTLDVIDWERRFVGDENSAPEPSFIGSGISNVFFFKNRLGFLSGENVILSRAGEYFNLFPSTATDVIDGDPIDVSVSSQHVSNLLHVVPYMNALLLFSEQQQFLLHGSAGILTPVSISIDPAISYEISSECTPVSSGSYVYFTVPQGQSTAVREYLIQTDGFPNKADDITSHVPTYLPKNVTKLATNANQNKVYAFSIDEPETLYVYQYYWDGDTKVQSSWSKWIFDCEICDINLIEDKMFLITKKNEEAMLQTIDFSKEYTGDLPFKIHLDNLIEVQGEYNPVTNLTTWQHELGVFNPERTEVVLKNGFTPPNITVVSPKEIQALGDYSEAPCYTGNSYTMLYRFNPWFVRDNNGIANIQGRLQLRTLILAYHESGTFKLRVNGRVRVFTGAIVGIVPLDALLLATGEKRFYIGGNARTVEIDIINDGYMPSTIQSASFEGFLTTRSRLV